MSLTSAPLGTQAFYLPLVETLQNSGNRLAGSAERLSSGNAIINAGDNVAALSVGTQLQAQNALITQASSNVAQATSLLQVAGGGLDQISSLITNLQSLATQAESSALTSTQRGFLQQQFSSYLSEIDTLVSSTSFNDINLLDGTLAGGAPLTTQPLPSTQATGALTFSANPTNGQTVVLNGVTLTAGTDFTIGSSTADTVANLASALNASTNASLSQASYIANGSQLAITAKSGGSLGGQYIINQAASTTSFTAAGGATTAANVFTLSGGADNGVGIGSTTASGAIGDAIVTAQAQTPASVTLALTGAVNNNETLSFDNGNGGTVQFTFVTGTPASNTQIQIGSTTTQTLQNIVSTVTQYSNNDVNHDNYGLRQLSFAISGNSLVISSRTPGNPTELNGSTPLSIASGVANSTLSAASFNNGVNTGVNTSGVTSDNFTGTISGFTATYVGANSITASVDVGGTTYTGAITNTLAGNSTVRFSSTNGGTFDVHLSGSGLAVANQAAATTYAGHLNSAFSTLSFYQSRPVTSFSPGGSLSGMTASLKLDSFAGSASNTATLLSNITVTPGSAPGGAAISVTINGQIFATAAGIASSIGAYQPLVLTNKSDANETLTLTGGATAQDFSTAANASALQTALADAFGLSTAATGTNFQVGPGQGTGNTLNVSIGNLSSYALFGGTLPNVSSVSNATAAATALTTASNTIQSVSATVGALEASLNAAAGNLAQASIGTAAAASDLLDTNIAAESTRYAQQSLIVNAGIAVLAQTFTLSPDLLQLLKPMGNG